MTQKEKKIISGTVLTIAIVFGLYKLLTKKKVVATITTDIKPQMPTTTESVVNADLPTGDLPKDNFVSADGTDKVEEPEKPKELTLREQAIEYLKSIGDETDYSRSQDAIVISMAYKEKWNPQANS